MLHEQPQWQALASQHRSHGLPHARGRAAVREAPCNRAVPAIAVPECGGSRNYERACHRSLSRKRRGFCKSPYGAGGVLEPVHPAASFCDVPAAERQQRRVPLYPRLLGAELCCASESGLLVAQASEERIAVTIRESVRESILQQVAVFHLRQEHVFAAPDARVTLRARHESAAWAHAARVVSPHAK